MLHNLLPQIGFECLSITPTTVTPFGCFKWFVSIKCHTRRLHFISSFFIPTYSFLSLLHSLNCLPSHLSPWDLLVKLPSIWFTTTLTTFYIYLKVCLLKCVCVCVYVLQHSTVLCWHIVVRACWVVGLSGLSTLPKWSWRSSGAVHVAATIHTQAHAHIHACTCLKVCVYIYLHM